MQYHHKVYRGRAQTKKLAGNIKAKLSHEEIQKRRQLKDLITMFPAWKFLKQHVSHFITNKKRAV